MSADTFVIKSYETQEAEEYYLKETDAFRTLRSSGGHSNIIGYHGSFIRGGTYNLILEYANEGTLEDYFWRTKAPLRGEDILRLWQGLSKLVGALKMIHNVPRSESDRLHLLQGYSHPLNFSGTERSLVQMASRRKARQHFSQAQQRWISF